MEKFFISKDAADSITKNNLKDYRNTLQKELDEYFLDNSYLHPEDVIGNQSRIHALNLIIHDFGEE